LWFSRSWRRCRWWWKVENRSFLLGYAVVRDHQSKSVDREMCQRKLLPISSILWFCSRIIRAERKAFNTNVELQNETVRQISQLNSMLSIWQSLVCFLQHPTRLCFN
jgi:hypothetical protein